MRGLRSKRVLITGGASGVGAATAKRLLEEGARVVVLDCNYEALSRIKNALPSLSGTISTDASDGDAVACAFTELDELLSGARVAS